MKIKIVAVLTFCLALNAFGQKTMTVKYGNTKYSQVMNDPTKTRIYTLDNGLKVYLSKNTKEPKIQTYVAVRTGSTNDPADNTGLAHYLEHMLFKGNSKLGALNWKKEKPLLDKISNLYEQHKAEKDPAKKKRLYKQIDSVSVIAAQYVAPNEFNDLMASFGAGEFNAFTYFNETVYESIIPSNELERWAKLESDRFSELTLRLFHTELEAVYEEYNGTQVSDGHLMQTAFLKNIFPNSPYSDQTLIGTSEHLKSPSMKAIERYFKEYYVPNNMAVILVGDLDYEKSIASIKKHFGKMKRGKNPIHKTFTVAPVTQPVVSEVVSPSQEFLRFGYRIKGTNSREAQVASLVNKLLLNGTAGLIDINVNQSQKVLGIYTQLWDLKDYRIHYFNVTPKEGQSLDEAKDLILAQIEKIKKGEFEDWLLKAVINQMKIGDQKALESSTAIGTVMQESFIKQLDWKEIVFGVEELSKISKQEIMEVANRIYQNNYHIVYKKQGDYKNLVQVEKPSITALELSKEHSEYYKNTINTQSEDLQPQFVDFDKAIHRETVKGSPFYHIKNEVNDLAELQYITAYGSAHNKKLMVAIGYLSFLGTKDLTVEEIKKQKFNLGIGFYPNFSKDRTILKITGLDKNMVEGIKLIENIIQNGVVEDMSFNILKNALAQNIASTKTDPDSMFERLFNYTK